MRTPEEYERGHRPGFRPGFRPAPGGQLVQETDWFAPVRGALLVLADDGGGRAAMSASWLAQMGWDVVVTTGSAATLADGPWTPDRPPSPDVPSASPARVEEWLLAGRACVMDVDTSPRFLAGHVPGAAWALRTDLARVDLTDRIGSPDYLVLTSSDGYLASWAAADLTAANVPWLRRAEVVVLAGGTQGWARSGRPVESGAGPMLSPAVDVYRRPYEGTSVDPIVMQDYLDWEHGLVAQLERDGTHGFTVLTF